MSHDDLEDRLEALLHDRGLDLPPQLGATGIVEGQVRRARRRRRAAQTALPAALTMVAIAAGISLPGDETAETPAQSTYDILSGQGLGELRIGMDITEVQNAGLVRGTIERGTGKAGSCAQYEGVGSVDRVISDNGVVVQIEVDALAETPEAIHIGDTYGDVVKTYPQLGDVEQEAPGQVALPASGGDGNLYQFTFETHYGSLSEEDPRSASEVNVIRLGLLAPSQIAKGSCRFGL